MPGYDTEIRVKTKVDNSELGKTEDQVEEVVELTGCMLASLEKTGKATDKLNKKTETLKGNFDGLTFKAEKLKKELDEMKGNGLDYGDDAYDEKYIAWQDAAYAAEQYRKELDKATDKSIAQEAERAAKAAEKQAAEEAKLKEQEAEEERLESIRLQAVASNQNLLALYEEQQAVIARMHDLEKAGVSNGYDEYEALKKKLSEINSEINNMDKGYEAAGKSANNLSKMLNKMLIRMAMLAAVNAAINTCREGFINLVQASNETNQAISDLKSEMATLKNSMASAFAPIVTMIVPYLTKLVSWLNIAMDYLARFWAILGGKNTYQKAKKQVVDYANSLKAASAAAKGALASFDEAEVLSKEESSGGGGEVTGADAFEEVEVDASKMQWVEWLRDNLDIIKGLILDIGIFLLGWKLASGFTDSLQTMLGIGLAAVGLYELIKNVADALENGLDWNNLLGILGSAVLLITGLQIAFGAAGMAVGMLISGLALFVVGLYDVYKNGVNLKNLLAVIIGTFLVVSSTAGMVAGAIAALIAGLVLAIIRDWDNFYDAVIIPLKEWGAALMQNAADMADGLKTMLNGITKFIKGVFTGDWKLAWEGIKDIFGGAFKALVGLAKTPLNLIIGFFNTLANGIIAAVNAIIDLINTLSWDVPDWVPFIGGESFGFNVPKITKPYNIPYLETGGIATGATLAMVGERGSEAVLPLENHTEWMDELAAKIGSNQTVNIRFTGTLSELGRVLKPVIETENTRIGTNLKLT